MAIRLSELGLLPEEQRLKFVSKIIVYTLDGSDLYAIESLAIQSVFTPEELAEFRRLWRNELVPKLESIRFDWELNHYSDHEPDGHMQPLLDSLESLKVGLSDDPKVVAKIDKQIDLIQEWIVTKLADDKPESRPPRVLEEVSDGTQAPSQERSIFDDIDE